MSDLTTFDALIGFLVLLAAIAATAAIIVWFRGLPR